MNSRSPYLDRLRPVLKSRRQPSPKEFSSNRTLSCKKSCRTVPARSLATVIPFTCGRTCGLLQSLQTITLYRSLEMKVEVSGAIEEIQKQFAGAAVSARDDGQGGAYVIIDRLSLG